MSIPGNNPAFLPTTPTICEYFRSYYYTNTYLDPVDLRQTLPQKRPVKELDVVLPAQKITSDPRVHKAFSDRFTNQPDKVREQLKFLKKHGFQPPKSSPHYRQLQHNSLKGWTIIPGGPRRLRDQIVSEVGNDQMEEPWVSDCDGLLSIAMGERIRQIARDLGIKVPKVEVPEQYAVPLKKPAGDDVTQKYFIVKKIDPKVPTQEDTINYLVSLNPQNQVKIAQQLAALIKGIGFANTSFDAVRISATGQIVFLETEPCGLLVDKYDTLYSTGHSVEKCARIGLYQLWCNAKEEKKLQAFANEIIRQYDEAVSEVSITRIVLSILCPLIPLVFLIISVVNVIRIHWLHSECNTVADNYFALQEGERPAKSEAFVVEVLALNDRCQALIEGVLFPMVFAS